MDHNSPRNHRFNNCRHWNPFRNVTQKQMGQHHLCDTRAVNISKPQYMRLDSAGENTIEEDIPTVIASRSNMGDKIPNKSLLGPSPYTGYRQPWRRFHHKLGNNTYPSDSTANSHWMNMNRNVPGNFAPSMTYPPYLGSGGQYLAPVDHRQYPHYSATPFQFGAGMGYDFNPQLYPWTMCQASFQAPAMNYPMPQQMYYGARNTPPDIMPSKNKCQRKNNYQNFHSQRQQRDERKHHGKKQHCDKRNHLTKSNMSCDLSHDLKPSYATGAAAIVEDMGSKSCDIIADPPVRDSAPIGDITKDIQSLDISSDSPASEPCLSMLSKDKIDSSGTGPDKVDCHAEPSHSLDSAIDTVQSSEPQCDLSLLKESKSCEAQNEPLTKKYATISVKKFFSVEDQVHDTKTDNPYITCDKNCVKDSPVNVTCVTPTIPTVQKQGLQSELDLIKDTYLPSDNKCECDTTKSNTASASGAQKNQVKSFRIKAFVSPVSSVEPDETAAAESIAGVHGASPNVEDVPEPCQFNAHIILTPKTDCLGGSRRKKTRPSCKKRQRKKAQRSENQTLPDTCEGSKKQKTEETGDVKSGAINVPKTKKYSFYVGVADNAEDNQTCSPSKASPELKPSPQSPCFSKFSFVIQSSELSSDSEEDSDWESDDDGFDESDEHDGADADFNADLWNSFSQDQGLMNFNIHCSFSPLPCDVATCVGESSPPTSPCPSTPDSAEASYADLQRSVKEANQKWNRLYTHYPDQPQAATPKKVLFADSTQLATVHVEEDDLGEEYQAARKGPWEEIARDRCRFQSRVAHFEELSAPIFNAEHRDCVYNKYHCQNEQN